MNRESGVFARRQLLALGHSANDIRRALEAGDLTRLRNGWFAIGSADQDVAAAVRSSGALSCVSVLRWHGLWVSPGYDSLHVRRVRTADGNRPSCAPDGRRLPVTQAVDPVPVALACATRCMKAEDWIAACDSYFNATGTGIADLEEALGVLSPRMRRLLDKTDRRSQSGTESVVRVRLRARGFHVEVQPRIAGVGRVDLRVGRLLIECDGEQYHSDRDAYRNDRRRDRRATIDGWIPMRLTYGDVMFGWAASEADIDAITSADRHRIRSRRAIAALHRSGGYGSSGGDLPPEWP
ncbi:MAG: hypothetical protein QM774_06470 [Gordonia sp. (in: high G+C Gram-positive bacteria)]|uniref:hypothetical protein n=1 Tax=Gordonia sp. (in: high G+C Gram-positive bacteria) TaxID=84139 RepID=UPI0039E31717